MALSLEDLIGTIKRGECSTVEFKRAPKGVAETVCSFLNTEGGVLLVGVDDGGGIVGAPPDAEQRVSDDLQGISPPPRAVVSTVAIGEKTLVVVEVERSPHLHAVGNVVYIRIGRNKRPLAVDEVVSRAVESRRVSFDALPSGAPIASIEPAMVERYLETRKRVRGVAPKGTLEENLRRLGIAVDGPEGPTPTNAGLLVFSEEPQHHLPCAAVRVVAFEDGAGDVVRDSKEFTGPLWRMVDDIESHLLRGLNVMGLRSGFKRRDLLEYPLDAIREALINALVHRNYYDESDVRIFIFPGRLVIRNPGSFPPGVTPEHPEHAPRNGLLCRYMYDLGYVERYGFGIERMRAACGRHPLAELEFNLRPFRTEVVFRKTKAPVRLEDADAKVISLVSDLPRASSEVARALGVSKVTAVHRLNRLAAMGLVRRSGKGRSLRYSGA